MIKEPFLSIFNTSKMNNILPSASPVITQIPGEHAITRVLIPPSPSETIPVPPHGNFIHGAHHKLTKKFSRISDKRLKKFECSSYFEVLVAVVRRF